MTTSSILIDTGAWYALADSTDRHSREAGEYLEAHAQRQELVTTTLVVGETWGLITSRGGRQAAMRFWEGLRDTRAEIVAVESRDLDAAWRIANSWSDQDFSLVDCTTFAVMERLGITEVFAFDSHFLVYRYGRDRQRAFRRLPR